MVIEIKELPYISLNDLYSGTFWGKRSSLKRRYSTIISGQMPDRNPRFSIKKKLWEIDKFSGVFNVKYEFIHSVKGNNRPYDATNTAYMAKLIEDVLFENDNWKHIRSVTLESKEADPAANFMDKVIITITEV